MLLIVLELQMEAFYWLGATPVLWNAHTCVCAHMHVCVSANLSASEVD